MMSKRKGVFKNFAVALALLAALILSFMLLVERHSAERCTALKITIEDSSTLNFVSRDMVLRWIDSAKISTIGTPMDQIDLFQIKQIITKQPYVSSVKVNSTMQGVVSLSIGQHKPQIRVVSENGYNFYADSLGNIIPTSEHYSANVPLVTGYTQFSFPVDFFGTLDQKNRANDIEYLKKLINFVEFIEQDKFLVRLLTQIYVAPDQTIELTTSTARQIIEFGTMDNVQEKLGKMRDFFRQAPSMVALGEPCRIVVKYRDQIILVKN